jgi:3-methyladenine DNA glycosylase AlkD
MGEDRFKEIMDRLSSMENHANREGMARYGIRTQRALGVSMPALRGIAKEIGKDHPLAGNLWKSGVHEARILACLIDDPDYVSGEQMEAWVQDFDSWDLCDQCCSNLFDRTSHAREKAVEWSGRPEEFVKRAGFVIIAALAVHDKKAEDAVFFAFLPLIRRESTDERNFVKKAVNWALRQIGKRNLRLNQAAVDLAEELAAADSGSARWIGRDALRELQSDAVQKRLSAWQPGSRI